MRLSALFSGCLLAVTTFFAISSLAASQGTFKRDGSNWTLTEQGPLSLDPKGNITIKAAGNIRIRGTGSAQAAFRLTRSVRAKRSADAKALLDRYPVSTLRLGTTTLFQAAYGPFATNLEITVPRTLQLCTVESPAGDLDISDLNGSLAANAAGGRINIGHVGGDLEIHAAGGSIVIGFAGGSVRVLSGGGSINAIEIRGDAYLETGGSDIVLRKAGGRVRASTAGGSIQVLEARDAVVANTFGGPIQVGSAKAIRCESASGSIVARFLPGAAIFDSFLSTGAGDITVWIPSNLQISIRAQNEGVMSTETVVSDFPGLRVRLVGTVVLAELQINGGGPLLQMAGNGGRIFIRKR